MRRIVVAGVSGGGKSYVSGRLAKALDLPLVEPDAMYHLSGWQPAPVDQFRAKFLGALDAAVDGWVVDGNYDAVATELWERADTVVWMDPPRRVVMAQLLLRTTLRLVRRDELYNGNRESFSSGFGRDGILRSTWLAHPRRRAQLRELAAEQTTLDLRIVTLGSRGEIRRWLRDVRDEHERPAAQA